MTKNLIYYIYPVAGNGTWQRNVAMLLQRIDLFDGKRVCAIARQAGVVQAMDRPPHTVDPPEAVREALAGHGFDFIEVDNDPGRGEVVGFRALMDAVKDKNAPGDVTFYGHAKGVTHPVNHPIVHGWTDLLYMSNLDYWPLVEKQFRGGVKATGSLRRMIGGRFWHFAGAFFWFCNRAVFDLRWWHRLSQRYGGVESWPRRVFPPGSVGCLFDDEPIHATEYHCEWLETTRTRFNLWALENKEFLHFTPRTNTIRSKCQAQPS